MNQSLHNIACWAYWEGQETYMPGTYRHNAPWFEALTGMIICRNSYDLRSFTYAAADESGWAWFIPLHNGTVCRLLLPSF